MTGGIERELRDVLARVERRVFFAELNPELHASDAPLERIAGQPAPAPDTGPATEALLRAATAARLAEHGHVELGACCSTEACAALATAIERLVAVGLHPTFVFVYDEAWRAILDARAALRAVDASFEDVLPDFWAFRVLPGARGWAPHRDFYEPARAADGALHRANLWLALTDATPPRSVIHIVGLRDDPAGPVSDDVPPDATPRTLPAPAGHALVWNANLLHWGGPSGAEAMGPRTSVACTVGAADYDAPDLAPIDPEAPFTFQQRLDLVAQQFVTYGAKHETLDATLMTWARSVVALADLALGHAARAGKTR